MITGAVLAFNGFGDFESNNFMFGAIMSTVGFFVGGVCLMYGFSPEIAKLRIKFTKHVQQENKDDLKDIANNTADITSDAITKNTIAVKKRLDDTKYCKYCGKEIDFDSIFCNKCGKEQ